MSQNHNPLIGVTPRDTVERCALALDAALQLMSASTDPCIGALATLLSPIHAALEASCEPES